MSDPVGTFVEKGPHDDDHTDHLHTLIEALVKQGWPEAEQGVLDLASSIQERVERAVALAVKLGMTLHMAHAEGVEPEDASTWPRVLASFPQCDASICTDVRALVEGEGWELGVLGVFLGGKPN